MIKSRFLVGFLALGLIASNHTIGFAKHELAERVTQLTIVDPQYYRLNPRDSVCFYDATTDNFLKPSKDKGVKRLASSYSVIIEDKDGIDEVDVSYLDKQGGYIRRNESPPTRMLFNGFIQQNQDTKGLFRYRVIDTHRNVMTFEITLEDILRKAIPMKIKPKKRDINGKEYCDPSL